MSTNQRIIRAITVSIGDEVELVDGRHVGLRAKITDKRPKSTLYATHIKVKTRNIPEHFRNKWVPVTMWRKVD